MYKIVLNVTHSVAWIFLCIFWNFDVWEWDSRKNFFCKMGDAQGILIFRVSYLQKS
jgi:hypothetical protein